MVGEILHPMAYDQQDGRVQSQIKPTHKNPEATSSTVHPALQSGRPRHMYSTAEEMAVYAKSIQVDDISQRTYMRYCDENKEPEVYIDRKVSESEYEFKKSLLAVSVDFEDVKGMENLAANSFIGDVIPSGQYEGMQQGESALLATALTTSTLVFVEKSLQVEEEKPAPPRLDLSASRPALTKATSFNMSTTTGFTAMSSASGRPNSFSDLTQALSAGHGPGSPSEFMMSHEERVPVMQKDQSLINKRSSMRYSVELSEKSKTKVDEIWHSNANFTQVGLEEEIHSSLNKYLYSQHIYGQEVDPERLAKRYVFDISHMQCSCTCLHLFYYHEQAQFTDERQKYCELHVSIFARACCARY